MFLYLAAISFSIFTIILRGILNLLYTISHCTYYDTLHPSCSQFLPLYSIRQSDSSISAWIYRACYRHGCTKNPELATLFARCSRLLALPIMPLFVFDGPNRPKIKCGKNVRENPHWLTEGMKEMLDSLAFPWIDVSHFLPLSLLSNVLMFYIIIGPW